MFFSLDGCLLDHVWLYTLFDVVRCCWFLLYVNWMCVLACSMWQRAILWARQVCINHNGLWQGMERMILLARHWHTTLIPKPMGHDVYSMIPFFYGSDTNSDFVLSRWFLPCFYHPKEPGTQWWWSCSCRRWGCWTDFLWLHGDLGVTQWLEVTNVVSFVTLAVSEPGDRYSFFVIPGKHPESNSILSAYSLICICKLAVARHWL